MPKAKNQSGNRISPTDYNRVVDIADLLDVKLIKSEFDVKPEFFGFEPDELSMRYGCKLVQTTYERGQETALGVVAVEAGCKVGRKWILHSRAIYLVVYALSGDPEPAAVEEYLSRVGRFTAYPYFRAHFSHLCSGAGAMLPPMPVLKGNLPRMLTPEGATRQALPKKDQ